MNPAELFDLISDRQNIWLDPLSESTDYLTDAGSGIPLAIWKAAFVLEYNESEKFKTEINKRLKEEAAALVDLAMKIMVKPEVKTASVPIPVEEAYTIKEILSPSGEIKGSRVSGMVLDELKKGNTTVTEITKRTGAHFTTVYDIINKYIKLGVVSSFGKGKSNATIYGLADTRKTPEDVKDLILYVLKSGPMTQEQIAEQTNLNKSTVKYKLNRMKSYGYVRNDNNLWRLP
jgi:predicted transcriptional regulator